MHDKIIEFSTQDRLGRCFAEAIDITPRGGGLTKIAGALSPEVAIFLRELKPDPKFQFVLMTPMGAFEVWGANSNGDIFPEISLSYDKLKDDPLPVALELEKRWLSQFGLKIPPGNYSEFGHKTFLNALRYRHHQNKQPEFSYGDIVFVTWNPSMKRVELIVRHDREKAKKVGAEDIIRDIDDGKPRYISMGCKVPFDVCTRCGHISKTSADYCDHLRLAMGTVAKDGKVVGAVNFFPRFFDLSDVLVPAAKESGVLRKVASEGGGHRVIMKRATIEKDVLPNVERRSLNDTCAAEPSMPREMLRGPDLAKLLTTMAMLGMVAKPSEFQYGMLNRMGQRGLADELADRHQVFAPSEPLSSSAPSADDYSPNLARLLAPMLGDRSGFYPHLPARMLRITIIKAQPVEEEEIVDPPVLKKVAAAYAGYRASLRHLVPALELVVERDPEYYRSNFFGGLMLDTMAKTASAHMLSLSVPPPAMYLHGAYSRRYSETPEHWLLTANPHSPARALLQPVLRG